MGSVKAVFLMKGDAMTPARFWDYIAVLPSEEEMYRKQGYVPCQYPRKIPGKSPGLLDAMEAARGR